MIDTPPPPTIAMSRALPAVAVGGGAGTLARYGLTVAFPAHSGAFPWTIGVINVSGSLLIGLVMGLLSHRSGRLAVVRVLLTTGFLGAFTTFSTFGVGADQLIRHHESSLAVMYLVTSAAAGLVTVVLGLRLGRAIGSVPESALSLAEEAGA